MDQRYRPNGAGYVIMPYISDGVCMFFCARARDGHDVMCRIYFAPLGLGGITCCILPCTMYHGLQPWLFISHLWCLYADDHPGQVTLPEFKTLAGFCGVGWSFCVTRMAAVSVRGCVVHCGRYISLPPTHLRTEDSICG